MSHIFTATRAIAVAGLVAMGATAASAQTVTTNAAGTASIYTVDPTSQVAPSSQALANAKSRLPMLTDLSQVPGMGGVTPQGYGTLNHPFTTKGAYSAAANGAPVFINPWRSAGKLWMRFGSSWFICSASVIQKGLVVTAAHCIHNYGTGPTGYADQVYFEPARHDSNLRYGQWDATGWVIPTVYQNGTDTCTTTGVVCENDIAILIMETGGSLVQHAGKNIAQVVSRYGYWKNNTGYTNFLGQTAAQITQLGYPGAFDSGVKMIRTDSLGYQATPSNVIIGSDQTGGSSGGPWIMNFGWDPSSTSSTPSFNQRNKVVATTSWGYVSSTLKVQGASRFANNGAFPSPGDSNIDALINAACTSDSSKCF